MTETQLKKTAFIYNIVASSLSVLVVILAFIFARLVGNIDSVVIDTILSLILIFVIINIPIGIGTLIYMIVQKSKVLLPSFFWMIGNQVLLTFSLVVYTIIGLSEIW